MKQRVLIAFGFVGVLSIVACQKAVSVSRPSVPASTGPAAVATFAPARAGSPSPAPSTAKQPAARPNQTAASRSTTLPAGERATLNERLARLEDALFDYDQTTIRSDATTALKDDVSVIRDILANYPSQKLVIEGNADERGSTEYNLALGNRRARATEQFLSTMGIPVTQLTVISYGKERPVCTDQTAACWQKNRRAHITAAP
jgi:peptidoglycan-associated lipoprotein